MAVQWSSCVFVKEEEEKFHGVQTDLCVTMVRWRGSRHGVCVYVRACVMQSGV